ncbi:hypothetical protein BV378_07005 [Nostoc sp. RF31YmG]|nr:hypothetical protein BV378_07005 [Nostoc sp. RF31YmG]
MKTQIPWLFEVPFPSIMDRFTHSYTNLEYDHDWLFEAPTALPVIPPLLFVEPLPIGLTLYVKIPLGGESPAQPMTGIYIPTNYQRQDRVDLILYLHGHHRSNPVKGKRPTHGYWPTTMSINQHWNKGFYPYYAFREGVNASGKNVILVAPTLGPKSQTVSLVKPGGLDAYLNQVMVSLNNYGPYKGMQQPPTLGNLILACHSGGGLPMRQLALSKNNYSPHIKQCWGFDCTYFDRDDTEWARWAKMNPTSRLYIYYATEKPTYWATRLQAQARTMRLSNVLVEKSPTQNHFKVPLSHWESRIKATPFLYNR